MLPLPFTPAVEAEPVLHHTLRAPWRTYLQDVQASLLLNLQTQRVRSIEEVRDLKRRKNRNESSLEASDTGSSDGRSGGWRVSAPALC